MTRRSKHPSSEPQKLLARSAGQTKDTNRLKKNNKKQTLKDSCSTTAQLYVVSLSEAEDIFCFPGAVVKFIIDDELAHLYTNSSDANDNIIATAKFPQENQGCIGLLTEVLSLKQDCMSQQFVVYLKVLQRIKILKIDSIEGDLRMSVHYAEDKIELISDHKALEQRLLQLYELYKPFGFFTTYPLEQENSCDYASRMCFFVIKNIMERVNVINADQKTVNSLPDTPEQEHLETDINYKLAQTSNV